MRRALTRLATGHELVLWKPETTIAVLPAAHRTAASTHITEPTPHATRDIVTSPLPDHTGPSVASAHPRTPVSFVEQFMTYHPRAFFYDVLVAWSEFQQGQNNTATDDALRHVPLREQQLLNGKLYDISLNTPGVPDQWGSEPISMRWHHTSRHVSALHMDRNEDAPLPSRATLHAEVLAQPGGLFYCYSLVHFASELGSVPLMDFALSRLPDGVPFIPRDGPTAVYPGTPLLPRGSCHGLCTSVDWIACHGADFTGAYPSHLAAASGATDVLDWLTKRYDAAFVLQRQHTRPSLRGGVQKAPAVPRPQRQGLTAVGCALASGQLATLEWLHATHPELLKECTASSQLVAPLLTAAVRPGEGCARSLQFLRAHHLLHDALGSVACAAEPTPREIQVALREAGCHAALFAAAESGNTSALQWFLRHCGDALLLVADPVGATMVHHCARGGQQALLRWLLEPMGCPSLSPPHHTTTGAADEASLEADLVEVLWRTLPAAARRALVDAPDDRGRTPAAWCVLGSTRPLCKMETLATLTALGSAWPQYRGEQGQTLLDLARLKHSHFSPLCRYIRSQLG